jgi:hypothetical protein
VIKRQTAMSRSEIRDELVAGFDPKQTLALGRQLA